MSYDHKTQVGGNHYSEGDKPQHWDLVLQYGWDYFQGQIIKYLMRWKTKYEQPEKRLEDLKKARNFLDKYIATEEQKLVREKMAYEADNAVMCSTGSINKPNPGYDMLGRDPVRTGVSGAADVLAMRGRKLMDVPETSLNIPGYAVLEVARKPQAIESNEWWTNEGYYGDMTQLYKCRQCKSTVRTGWAPPPHGCMVGAQQKQAPDAVEQRVEAVCAPAPAAPQLTETDPSVPWPPREAGSALGAVAGAGRTIFQTGSGNS